MEVFHPPHRDSLKTKSSFPLLESVGRNLEPSELSITKHSPINNRLIYATRHPMQVTTLNPNTYQQIKNAMGTERVIVGMGATPSSEVIFIARTIR